MSNCTTSLGHIRHLISVNSLVSVKITNVKKKKHFQKHHKNISLSRLTVEMFLIIWLLVVFITTYITSVIDYLSMVSLNVITQLTLPVKSDATLITFIWVAGTNGLWNILPNLRPSPKDLRLVLFSSFLKHDKLPIPLGTYKSFQQQQQIWYCWK